MLRIINFVLCFYIFSKLCRIAHLRTHYPDPPQASPRQRFRVIAPDLSVIRRMQQKRTAQRISFEDKRNKLRAYFEQMFERQKDSLMAEFKKKREKREAELQKKREQRGAELPKKREQREAEFKKECEQREKELEKHREALHSIIVKLQEENEGQQKEILLLQERVRKQEESAHVFVNSFFSGDDLNRPNEQARP